MKGNFFLILTLTIVLAIGVAAITVGDETGTSPAAEASSVESAQEPAEVTQPDAGKPRDEKEFADESTRIIRPAAVAPFLEKGISWLIAAQQENGGWGGGSHARQDVRDPHEVQTDPATTAFTCLALLRAGHSPVAGEYQDQVRKATEYLVSAVEEADTDGPRITSLTGTQPQSKLGPYVDTALTAQYLARILPTLPQDAPLHPRVDKALEKCLAKLQATQEADGSWGRSGGWAPVLQSSLSCTALEIAQANGKPVDDKALENARRYLKGNVDAKTGRASADAAAGVELYAYGGGQRASAVEARQALDAIDGAKNDGKLERDAPVSEENLRIAGVAAQSAPALAQAAEQAEAQFRRLGDESLLAGFGNNGGEEFLSYLMTSESLVIAGGDKFHQWNDKIHGRLQKVQNPDGSWSGHHCITSPVFCTAAVVQCLTTDRDAEFLVGIAKNQVEAAKVANKD